MKETAQSEGEPRQASSQGTEQGLIGRVDLGVAALEVGQQANGVLPAICGLNLFDRPSLLRLLDFGHR